MIGAVLAGAIITSPQGNQYIQPMGNNSYNIWSSEGITQVRDFNGWQQINEPDGTVIKVIDQGPGIPIVPVIPLESGE